jgi:hypothetical protein
MNRFQANDLRDLIKEVVFAYRDEKLKWLLESPETLQEGVFDRGILKCVFTAGGPGSGKSFIADLIFGMRSLEEPHDKTFIENASFLRTSGLKYVNSDKLFERGLTKMGISPKDLADIEALPGQELWDIIQGGDPESIRSVAKGRLEIQRAFFESGRLGVLVDGTGRQFDKIAGQKEKIEKLGYDTAMIFVNTSLEVALGRNSRRARRLPEKEVEKMWGDVQSNMANYAQLFGNNFNVVNNDVKGPPPNAIIVALDEFVSEPVENRIGQAWIEGELERRGVTTLEPGGPEGFRGGQQAARRIQKMRGEPESEDSDV